MFDGVFFVWAIASTYGILMGALAPDWWWFAIGGAICYSVCQAVYHRVEK